MSDGNGIPKDGPLLAIVGPTAVGKSSLSLSLAEQLNGEIINADSMQLYRGLDIGTAKLTATEQVGIPHHLLDVWDLDYSANVAEYQRLARLAITDIRTRDRLPILVGGSGLYLSAVLDNLSFPATDPATRQRWETRLAEVGPYDLHNQLAAVDPVAAARIESGNGRRIVRALEVIELTGQPYNANLPIPGERAQTVVVGLRRQRSQLDELIELRVHDMWRSGLVSEVEGLRERGLESAPTASRALGYAQVLAMLIEGGNEVDACNATITATRRFARKQQSWFGRDQHIRWLDVDSPVVVDDLVESVTAGLRA